MHTRIIGIGNPDRGDDMAGLLVARRLRELDIDAAEFSGEALSLIDLWEGYENVILVDAVVTGTTSGEIVSWNACEQRVPRTPFKRSTHTFSIADAVELGRITDKLPKALNIFGIEGRRFTPGTEASKRVRGAVERLARQLAGEVARWQSTDASTSR